MCAQVRARYVHTERETTCRRARTINANEALLCSRPAFSPLQHRPQRRFPLQVHTGQAGDRPRASASLEAICPAAIDDWQFVKISRGGSRQCVPIRCVARTRAARGICGLCKCISLACLLRSIDRRRRRTFEPSRAFTLLTNYEANTCACVPVAPPANERASKYASKRGGIL